MPAVAVVVSYSRDGTSTVILCRICVTSDMVHRSSNMMVAPSAAQMLPMFLMQFSPA